MHNQNIADHLFDRSRAAVQAWPKGYAEILQCLVWMMDDNGDEIVSAVECWLSSDDYERVRVALEFEDVFPFKHAAEMEAALAVVAARWPELTQRCQLLVSRRAELRESDAPPVEVQQRVERLRAQLKKMSA